MSRRQSLFAYAALLLGVTAFAASFVGPTSGQLATPASPGPTINGRYHVAATANGGAQHVYVTDSVTGQTWHHSSVNNGWDNLGSPISTR